jgi:hypothetical protein
MAYRVELPPASRHSRQEPIADENLVEGSLIPKQLVRPVRSGEEEEVTLDSSIISLRDSLEPADTEKDEPPVLRFSLIVTRAGTVESTPTVRLNAWTVVTDIPNFVDANLRDLASYVAARNKGRTRHWAEDLLDEKVAGLRLCGVEAEIREIH